MVIVSNGSLCTSINTKNLREKCRKNGDSFHSCAIRDSHFNLQPGIAQVKSAHFISVLCFEVCLLVGLALLEMPIQETKMGPLQHIHTGCHRDEGTYVVFGKYYDC